MQLAQGSLLSLQRQALVLGHLLPTGNGVERRPTGRGAGEISEPLDAIKLEKPVHELRDGRGVKTGHIRGRKIAPCIRTLQDAGEIQHRI